MREFEELVKKKFSHRWIEKMEEYHKFFETLPIAVKTNNKVCISHSGPSNTIKSLDDFPKIKKDRHISNAIFDDMLWKRPGTFDKKELEIFLENIGCRVHVVGHTPVKGYEIVQERQLVLSSSSSKTRNAYLKLELDNEVNLANDLIKMIRYLRI